MTRPTHRVTVESAQGTGHDTVSWTPIDDEAYVQPLSDITAVVWSEHDGADDALVQSVVHVQLDVDDGTHVKVMLNDGPALYEGDTGETDAPAELLRRASAAYFGGDYITLNKIMRGAQS